MALITACQKTVSFDAVPVAGHASDQGCSSARSESGLATAGCASGSETGSGYLSALPALMTLHEWLPYYAHAHHLGALLFLFLHFVRY